MSKGHGAEPDIVGPILYRGSAIFPPESRAYRELSVTVTGRTRSYCVRRCGNIRINPDARAGDDAQTAGSLPAKGPFAANRPAAFPGARTRSLCRISKRLADFLCQIGAVAEAAELRRKRIPYVLVILYQEDDLAPSVHAIGAIIVLGRSPGRSPWLSASRSGQWCLHPGLTVAPDVPAGLPDETVGLAQPELGALAGSLGRKERLECPIDHFRHTGPPNRLDRSPVVFAAESRRTAPPRELTRSFIPRKRAFHYPALRTGMERRSARERLRVTKEKGRAPLRFCRVRRQTGIGSVASVGRPASARAEKQLPDRRGGKAARTRARSLRRSKWRRGKIPVDPKA